MAIRLDQYNNQLVVSDTVTANAPLVLQPQGTGALQAQLTDSTATGGNARGANAASTVLMGTPAINRVAATAGATAWAIAITADTTNGGLAVTVTGAASTTIRWVCKAETTEVTF